MADENKIQVTLGVDVSGLASGMSAARDAVASSTAAMKSSLSGLGDAFMAMKAPLLALSAIVAGGAFFKEAINDTKKLNGETMGLSKSLGITGNEASTLHTALNDIGSDSDTYVGAFQKFAKQIKTNEQGLQDMGLKTRDANGELRNSNTLFTEAVGMVGDYKAGLDQNIAAQTLFGRGVADVMTLQKLNIKVLEEARVKNEELGLTMTQEGVESGKKYTIAMKGVGEVFQAIQKVIGEAVMPVFTELANMFSAVGPTAVFVFKVAIDTVSTVLRTFVGLVHAVVDVVHGLLNPLFEVAEAFKKLIQGDPAQNFALMAKEKAKQLELERAFQIAKTNILTKAAVEDAKYGKQFEDGMNSGFSSVIKNFAAGTMTIQSLFVNMGKAVLSALTDVFAQIAAKWLANKVMQAIGTKVSATAEIMASAAAAGAAAFKSTAAIPIVGPGLAPEAGAAAYAGAASFAKMPGFAVGAWNVPHDMLTKVHAGETILNATDSENFRRARDGDGGDNSSTIHIHGTKDDTVKVKDLGVLLKKMRRNFELVA